LIWTAVVLFPIYWLFVTSFKLPIDVNTGPFYIPFVDFKPSLHAWDYILAGALANDTRRNFLNTLIVAPISAGLALVLGTAAAYALIRFEYRPRLGAILSFIGCLALAVLAITLGAPWQLALIAMLVLFVIVLQTIGRRFNAWEQ
jgi:multiple sugar transport system permease protein